ncbi:MAG: METTL5 family protein [Candidatus Thermoplasmatota archaeon]|nr:METTL5 family protein [Candidatus Thermoplasmatota archaeon]
MSSTKLISIKKKELEKILQRIPQHPEPKPELEQYVTPASIAADLLFLAYSDIVGNEVVDLGCGTGIFAIGAKLMGARKCIGVDKDEKAIAVAKQICNALGLKKIKFEVCRIEDFKTKCDTVIQNPPFGAQEKQKHIDRIFIKKALELAPVVYSFHLTETKNFVKAFVESLNAGITFEKIYKFPIKYTFKFHRKEKLEFEVSLFRFERK